VRADPSRFIKNRYILCNSLSGLLRPFKQLALRARRQLALRA